MAKVTQVQDSQSVPAAAPKRRLKFSEYAIDQFKPNIVVRKLFDLKKTNAWQAGLLFHALRAWIIANDDRKFIRDSVVRQIGDVLAQLHTAIMAKWAAKPGASFVAMSAELAKTPFMKKIVEPIGGMAAIMDTCSNTELEHARKSKVENARSVVDLMSVVHLYATTGGEDAHPSKMSLQFVCELVKVIQQRRRSAKLSAHALSADRLRDRWGEMACSSALIYAAVILEHEGISLFDNLYATSHIQFPSGLNRWLKLSKRISKDVNKHWVFHKGKKPRFARFPTDMKLAKLPPPKLRLCEAWWLVERFQDVPMEWPAIEKEVQRRSLKPCAISDGSIADGCAACARFKGRFDDEFLPIIAMR